MCFPLQDLAGLEIFVQDPNNFGCFGGKMGPKRRPTPQNDQFLSIFVPYLGPGSDLRPDSFTECVFYPIPIAPGHLTTKFFLNFSANFFRLGQAGMLKKKLVRRVSQKEILT